MKTFKSFIQLDEVERAKYKDGIANKMAAVSYLAQTKDPGDLEKVGPEEVGPHDTKTGQGKRPADRLDNKQPFGEGDAYDKDVKASPKPHDKEAAAQRAKLAALAARKAMMTNKMSEAESHQSKTTMKHIDKPNAAEKEAAKRIKPGIKGIRDRFAMLQAAKNRGALKNEDVDLLSNLYDQLDESNQEIFLNQLEEDAEVLLAFAKTIAEE
jgi:hypothetical protein